MEKYNKVDQYVTDLINNTEVVAEEDIKMVAELIIHLKGLDRLGMRAMI